MARGSAKQSMTASPSFLNWSFEELRLYDYSIGNRGESAATTSAVGLLSSIIGTAFHDTAPSTNMQSITAKFQYLNWSFEELRLQDYSMGIRGGSPAGTQGSFLFRSSAVAQTVVVGHLGLPPRTHACQATNDISTAAPTVKKQSIPAMNPLLDYSFEELRFRDYLLAKRGFASPATGVSAGTAISATTGNDLLLSPPSPTLPDMDESTALTPTPLLCFGVEATAFRAVPYRGPDLIGGPRILSDVQTTLPSGFGTQWPSASLSLFEQLPTTFCVAPTGGHFEAPPPTRDVDDPMPMPRTPLRPGI